MKALLIAATVSTLALTACSKQEETPAQAPAAAEQSTLETLQESTTQAVEQAQEAVTEATMTEATLATPEQNATEEENKEAKQ